MRSRRHPGAPQRREHGDQGPRRRQAQEADEVHGFVGEQQAVVKRIADRRGQQRTECRAHRQQARGGDVVGDGDGEGAVAPGDEIAAQRHRVPRHGQADDGRADGGHRPPFAELADDGDHDPAIEQVNPRELDPAGLLGDVDFQEALGEVAAPHEDRVRRRAESEQVHHQPAAVVEEGVDHRGDDDRREPPAHRTSRPAVPGGAAGAGGRFGATGGGGRGHAAHNTQQ